MTPEEYLQQLIMVLIDKDGYVIGAGMPSIVKKKKKEIMSCISEGGTVKTMTMHEYKAAKFEWIYMKPKNTNV